MLTPRSHILTSKSLSSGQLTQTGFFFLGLMGLGFRLAGSWCIGLANYRDEEKSLKLFCLVFGFSFLGSCCDTMVSLWDHSMSTR